MGTLISRRSFAQPFTNNFALESRAHALICSSLLCSPVDNEQVGLQLAPPVLNVTNLPKLLPKRSAQEMSLLRDTASRVGRSLNGNTDGGGGGGNDGAGGGELYSGWVGPTPLSLSCRAVRAEEEEREREREREKEIE